MSAKFQNKYRGESTRLQRWDYGWDAAYFITICTRNREPFFGNVRNGKMELSPVGVIADILWYEIKNHATNVQLGEFVVMPNHIHGIIILNGNQRPSAMDNVRKMDDVNVAVGVRHALPLQQRNDDEPQWVPKKTIGQQRFQNQGKNTLSSIVGSYKSAVTKHANRLNLEFGWQSLFYDHIIRDQQAFQNISNYIKHNPQKWKEDKFSEITNIAKDRKKVI